MIRGIVIRLIGGIVKGIVFHKRARGSGAFEITSKDVIQATGFLPTLFVIVMRKANKCAIGIVQRIGNIFAKLEHVVALFLALEIVEKVVVSIDKARLVLLSNQSTQGFGRRPLDLFGQIKVSDTNGKPLQGGLALEINKHNDLVVVWITKVAVHADIASPKAIVLDEEGHGKGNLVVTVSSMHSVILMKVGTGKEQSCAFRAGLEITQFNEGNNISIAFGDQLFDMR